MKLSVKKAGPVTAGMDEPSEGLAPIIIQGLWEAIEKLKQQGLSILLVEQNAQLALKLVDYVHETESIWPWTEISHCR